jgi:hypothetical protein
LVLGKEFPDCFVKSLNLAFAGFGALGGATDGGGLDSLRLLQLAHLFW